MSLQDTFNDFKTTASFLPEIEVDGVKTKKYEDYSINMLADNYCKAIDENDDLFGDVYFAALVLRFWYVINNIYESVKLYGYTRDDCFSRLCFCINLACKYRAWQNPEKHTNAQACINMAIRDRGAAMMAYEAKHLKNQRPLLLLDEQVDNDSVATRLDLVADNQNAGDGTAHCVVQQLIYDNKIVEAIITDNIITKDVLKYEKETVKEKTDTGEDYKYSKISYSFWPYQLVKELNALDEDYLKYFTNTYAISEQKLQLAFNDVKKAPNQNKYKFINTTTELIRNFYI